MPIYEYSCKKCGKTIEVIRKFSDPVLRKHKDCGGSLTKLISTASFQLKGTGWYVTDYARKGKGGESESSKENKESAPKSENSSKESSESSKESPKESPKEPAKKKSRDSGKAGE